HIGNDICQFASKHPAGAAESGEDLIRDEQYVVFRRGAANPLQKLDRMNDHAARSLEQRLHDDRRDLLMPLLEKLFQVLGTIDHTTGTGLTDRAAVTIGGM